MGASILARALCVSALMIGGAWAADPVDALFDKPHLQNLPAGAAITYRFERIGSDERLLGPSFADDIVLTVKSVASSGARDVEISVFTGDRQRPGQIITELTGNPLLVLFLDRVVSNLSRLARGTAARAQEQDSEYAERCICRQPREDFGRWS